MKGDSFSQALSWPESKQTPLLFHLAIFPSLCTSLRMQTHQECSHSCKCTSSYANQQSAWFPLPGSQRLICKIKAEASRVFQLPWLSEQGDVQLCNTGTSSEEEKGLAPTCSKNEEQNRSLSSFYLTHRLRQCCSHGPFAADKGSTTNVGVVPQVVGVGNLKWYLDQATTYFTPKPCHGSAEIVCVALDSGSCYFLTVCFLYFFFLI